MSKLLRASSAAACALLAVPLWAVPAAYAASMTEAASTGALFSATGVPDTGTNAGKPPNVTQMADGVAPGNLAVAGGGGREQKVSFLFFDLAELPIGGTVTSAQLTVPLVPSDDENVVIAADPAKVRACPAGPEGFGGEDGESLAVAPARLCDQAAAPAKLSTDGKSYVFDISEIAATWGEVNDGVALTAAEGAASTPFQIVFAPPSESMLTYEATAPEDTGTGSGTGGGVGTGGGSFDGGTADLGGGSFDGGTTDLGGGFDGGSLDVPDAGGFGTTDAPLVSDADVPLAAPESLGEAPEVATGGEQATVPVAATSGESLRPTAGFFLGALLLAAVLALLSLIMGDPRLPQKNERPSRLSQALQQRQRGGGRTSGLGSPSPSV